MPEPHMDDANAAAALVFHPDELLVLVECGPSGDRLPGVPGGKREPGETVAECATRELFEETGVVVLPSTLVPVLLAPAGRHLCQLFLAPRVAVVAELRAGARWAPIEELLGPSRFPDFYARAFGVLCWRLHARAERDRKRARAAITHALVLGTGYTERELARSAAKRATG